MATLKRLSHSSLRQFIAIALIGTLIGLLTPAPVTATALHTTERKLTAVRAQAWQWLESVRNALGRMEVAGNRKRKGVKPPAPPTKAEREARVAALDLNPSTEVVLQSKQPFLFTATPLDQEGQAIHGLQATWESSNKQVIFVRKNGEAIAGKPGETVVTAHAGSKLSTVRVTVVAGTNERFGGKKKADSTRGPKQTAALTDNSNTQASARTTSRRKRAHTTRNGRANASPFVPFLRDPNDDPLPDNETSSLYQPNNLVGLTPGKKPPGAFTPSPTVPVTESGNKNFYFGLPILSLPGRGLDVSLTLSYNSLLWNKSTNPSDSSTWMTYDVDSG
jgi:hypothetical protein